MSKLNKKLSDVFGTVAMDSAAAAKAVVQRPAIRAVEERESVQSPEKAEAVACLEKINDEIKRTNVDISINDNVNVNVDDNVNVNPIGETRGILKAEKATRFDKVRTLKGYWIDNELIAALDKLSKQGGKGFASNFMNDAIRERLKLYGIAIPPKS